MAAVTKIRFSNKDKNQFYTVLKKRVDQYFTDNNISKNANTTMVVKTIVLLSMYILPFLSILVFQPAFGISLLLWFVMSIGLAGVGMSIMHDANHGAYSSNPKINKLMGHSLNLVGGAVHNWKLQHNVLHHTYTNIAKVDNDIDGRKIIRLTPHDEHYKPHRFQWMYSFGIYGLLILYWVTLKDFVQFVKYNREGVNSASKAENRKILAGIILNKILYFFAMLVVPTLFFGIPFYQILIGFVLMHFSAGVILTVIFQLAHSVEGTAHPMPDEKGVVETDWAVHQMKTTVNFARHNKWLSWYVGGLNFQVEHHLFPKICHVHYPNIAPIVKQTAEEHGVPYLENETFGQAFKSHINVLQRFGKLPDINEAIG